MKPLTKVVMTTVIRFYHITSMAISGTTFKVLKIIILFDAANNIAIEERKKRSIQKFMHNFYFSNMVGCVY